MLRKFYKNTDSYKIPPPNSSFHGLDDEEIDTHTEIRTYGSFVLTGAVFPSYDLKVVPKAGFRKYPYKEGGISEKVLIISASNEALFALFVDLVSLVGNVTDVVLESSHMLWDGQEPENPDNTEYISEEMNIAVLLSTLYDFEDLLMRDGCFGICIAGTESQAEVQFDEHKILYFYNWRRFRSQIMQILAKYEIVEDNNLPLIYESEHVHASSRTFEEKFEELKIRLGAW